MFPKYLTKILNVFSAFALNLFIVFEIKDPKQSKIAPLKFCGHSSSDLIKFLNKTSKKSCEFSSINSSEDSSIFQ